MGGIAAKYILSKKNQSSSIRAGAFLRRLRQACASAKTGVFRSSVTLSRFPLAVSQGLNRDSLKTLRHSRFAGFAVVPYQSSGPLRGCSYPWHNLQLFKIIILFKTNMFKNIFPVNCFTISCFFCNPPCSCIKRNKSFF